MHHLCLERFLVARMRNVASRRAGRDLTFREIQQKKPNSGYFGEVCGPSLQIELNVAYQLHVPTSAGTYDVETFFLSCLGGRGGHLPCTIESIFRDFCNFQKFAKKFIYLAKNSWKIWTVAVDDRHLFAKFFCHMFYRSWDIRYENFENDVFSGLFTLVFTGGRTSRFLCDFRIANSRIKWRQNGKPRQCL